MAKASIHSWQAEVLVCYPRTTGCYSRISRLASIGIEEVCIAGGMDLGQGVRALGRGHSATVFAAVFRGQRVAVKSRRSDSRRDSLEGEAKLLEEASRAGAAPRVYYWDRDFIVMEYLPGPSLADVIRMYGGPPLWALVEALRAAVALDVSNVLHHEIHRPWKNVFYTVSSNPMAVVIDYDSASRGCGNLAKITSALVHLGVIEVDEGLRSRLRRYKKNCGLESIYSVAERILGLL